MFRLVARSAFRLWPATILMIASASAASAGPEAVIAAIDLAGPAPFTLHVHGLESSLGAGDATTALYDWDFGDPSAPFNRLGGWNAAHTYDAPGQYTTTLTLTNALGEQSQASVHINVTADVRPTIHVSPDGDDSNSGLTPASAVRTAARGFQLLASNTNIMFRRGGTYHLSASANFSGQNVVIGAYGSGGRPILFWPQNTAHAHMIALGVSCRDVTIQDLVFDSPFAPGNTIVRAIGCAGRSITVRRCRFADVSYAMNGAGGVHGWLSQQNSAGTLGAYYAWSEGSDHVHLGNTVGGSETEHVIRLAGATRVNLSHNNLRNQAKSTIWCMTGSYCYIRGNTLRDGRVIAGPNYTNSTPAERFRYLVLERNRIVSEGIVCYAGVEHAMIRNNVIRRSSADCISIWGADANFNRTCKFITIANNTAYNTDDRYGRFLKMGDGAYRITLVNNLYSAPGLNSPWGAGNVVSDDRNLGFQSYRSNLWATPMIGSSPHSIHRRGRTAAQWNTYSQTTGERHRAFAASDLNAGHKPQFDAQTGESVTGVFADLYGRPRPAQGPWTVGAVEQNVPAQALSQLLPAPPDVNGDGETDGLDVLAIAAAFGSCVDCAADLTFDGRVDYADVLAAVGALR